MIAPPASRRRAAAAAEAGDPARHPSARSAATTRHIRARRIRAGIEKGRVVARAADRRKGQRHRRHHRLVRAAAGTSIARSSTALKDVEVPRRGREIRRRSRGQLHAEGLAADAGSADRRKRPPAGGRSLCRSGDRQSSAQRRTTVAAQRARRPAPPRRSAIPASDTRLPGDDPQVLRARRRAQRRAAPARCRCRPPPTAQSTAGLRHAGSDSGAGSAAITRAVKPSSSR